MSYMVELIFTLLHIAMFLFFIGLVVFLFTITRKVAIITSVFVGISFVAYIALTILPCLYVNCPYRTPLSNLSWYMWHTVARYDIALFLWVEANFHVHLVQVHRRVRNVLVDWREELERYIVYHDRRRRDGLRKSIGNRAQSIPEYQEMQSLNWFLHVPALSEDSTFQNFVSTLTDDTIARMLQPPDSLFSSFFGGRLHDLLRTSLPGTTGLTVMGNAQQDSLLTCLDIIYRGVKAYNVAPLDQSGKPIPDNIRVNFAELRVMRVLWSHEDTAVRVRARCICALLARRILRDIGGPRSRRASMEADLYWLAAVFDKPSSNEIYNSLHNLAEVDSMNLNSFVRGVHSPLLECGLTNNDVTFILDTLTILVDAEDTPHRNSLQERIWALTQGAEISDCPQQFVAPLLELLREASPIDVPMHMSMPVPVPRIGPN